MFLFVGFFVQDRAVASEPAPGSGGDDQRDGSRAGSSGAACNLLCLPQKVGAAGLAQLAGAVLGVPRENPPLSIDRHMGSAGLSSPLRASTGF